ncbi:MAG: lysylphosphatidylglycerol synthase transmembrane domain-containing protein [Sumerlaeia bacterium]
MPAKKIISLAIALLLSGFFLWLAFRQIEFAMLWDTLKTANWWWAIPFVVVTWLTFVWRVWRWQLLLAPKQKVPFYPAYQSLMVGFGLNSVVPGRAGEAARPLALRRSAGVPFPAGLSTVFVERVLDSLTLLGLFALAPLLLQFDSDFSKDYDATMTLPLRWLLLGLGVLAAGGLFLLGRTLGAKGNDKAPAPCYVAAGALALAGVAAALFIPGGRDFTLGSSGTISPAGIQSGAMKLVPFVIVLIVGVIAMLFDPVRNLVLRIVMAIPLLPHKFKEKIGELFRHFAEGFDALKSPRMLAILIFHSVGVWIATGATIWIMAFGFPELELTFVQSMAFLIITCIAIAIPAAPGYWGLYEVGGLLALIMVGAIGDSPEEQALGLGFTLVIHFLQWILVTVIGLWYAAKLSITPGAAAEKMEEVEEGLDEQAAKPA